MALLTPLNVNCHASDGRKVRALPGDFCTFKHTHALPGSTFIWKLQRFGGFNACFSLSMVCVFLLSFRLRA